MKKFIEDAGSYFDCLKIIHCYSNSEFTAEFVIEYMTNRGYPSQKYHTVLVEKRNGIFRFFESITPDDFDWGSTTVDKVCGEEYHELTLDFLSSEKARLQTRLDKAEACIVRLKRK